ncbi:hypothetical protein F383_27626 [Gossypium arboreum]|uniref:Uncharacterized protein n=1 Tax=Gossypium arboreum TaxID=29729 RepID=A0A0B0P9T1_GOSAR|nr:hypothetical protein F383_26656 [Gossypium arboreum]KHG21621.1 hypothetical protein F383_27626 [Gossypium arboreum]
MESSFRKN